MLTKTCSKCNNEKDISEFHMNKHNKDGYKGWCKLCCRKYMEEHRDKKREHERNHYQERKPKRKLYLEKYRKTAKYKERRAKLNRTEKHRKYMREYTATRSYKNYVAKYRKDHIDEIRIRELRWEREYRKTPIGKIKGSLRARLGVILKRSNSSKSDKFIVIIGCTMPFLRTYLESLWKDGMSWDNYGFGCGKWVIDHIIPCDKFKPFTPEQQRECFNYKNLQPLWWEENAFKSNKLL